MSRDEGGILKKNASSALRAKILKDVTFFCSKSKSTPPDIGNDFSLVLLSIQNSFSCQLFKVNHQKADQTFRALVLVSGPLCHGHETGAALPGNNDLCRDRCSKSVIEKMVF